MFLRFPTKKTSGNKDPLSQEQLKLPNDPCKVKTRILLVCVNAELDLKVPKGTLYNFMWHLLKKQYLHSEKGTQRTLFRRARRKLAFSALKLRGIREISIL